MESLYSSTVRLFYPEEDALVQEYLDTVAAEESIASADDTWWSRFSCSMAVSLDPQVEKEEHVRSYWGDAVHDEALEEDEYKVVKRREVNKERTSASLFATEELSTTELAELGRLLAKSSNSGIEEKARLTQEFIAQKREAEESSTGRPKPGTVAWRERLDMMRGEISKDKKQLSSRHVKRAQFLDDQANKSEAKFASAKLRQRFSLHRLNDIRSRRKLSFSATQDEYLEDNFNDQEFSSSRKSFSSRFLSFASATGSGLKRPSSYRSRSTPPSTPLNNHSTRSHIPPPEDEETMEYRAAVDLFWKGRDDAI